MLYEDYTSPQILENDYGTRNMLNMFEGKVG
jgi:hypothetical protein